MTDLIGQCRHRAKIYSKIWALGAAFLQFQNQVNRLTLAIENLAQDVLFGTGPLQLSNFLPESITDMKYFTYHGSLTTPDYNEVVVWAVLEEVQPITTEQVRLLKAK